MRLGGFGNSLKYLPYLAIAEEDPQSRNISYYGLVSKQLLFFNRSGWSVPKFIVPLFRQKNAVDNKALTKFRRFLG
jgi:hypothetical protein